MELNQLYPEKKTIKLEVSDKIGSGSYGNVYKLKNSEKILKIVNVTTKKNKTIKPREIKNIFVSIYLTVKYPKLRKIMPTIYSLGIVTDGDKLKSFYLVMNNCGTELGDYVNKNNLNMVQILTILAKLAKALKMIHKKRIIHRDIKGENIMVRLDSKNQVEKLFIIDFGFMGHTNISLKGDFKSNNKNIDKSLNNLRIIIQDFNDNDLFKQFRFLEGDSIESDCVTNPDLPAKHHAKKYSCIGKTRMETFHYASPEHHAEYRAACLHLEDEYIGSAHDIYAVGVLFLEMLCQYCHPFKFKSREKLLRHLCYDYTKTLDSKTEFDYFIERLSPNLDKIIKEDYKLKKLVIFLAFGMLRQNPSKRLTLKKIISVLKPIVRLNTKPKTKNQNQNQQKQNQNQNKTKKLQEKKIRRKILSLVKKRKRKIYPLKLRQSVNQEKQSKSKNKLTSKKTAFDLFFNSRKHTLKKLKKSSIKDTDMIIYQ